MTGLGDRTTGRGTQNIAIAAVFAGLCVGYTSIYSATATTFILPLTKQFGWGRMVPSLMFLFAMLGVAIASLALGRVIAKIGAAATTVISALGLSLIMIGLSKLAGAPQTAYVLAFLAGLLGSGTGVGLYVSTLPPWFQSGLGKALGISVIGQSLGAMIMPPLAVAMMTMSGWRGAYLGLAALHFFGTLGVAAILYFVMQRRSGETGAPTKLGMTAAEALRRPEFWGLALVIFLMTIGMFAVTVHTFPIYSDRGIGWKDLALPVIVVSVGMAVGRLGSGLLLDRVDARLIGAILFTSGAAAVASLALVTHASTLALWLPPFFIGLALGTESDVFAYLTRRYFGLVDFAAIYNRLLVAYYLGAMSGPAVFGWSVDRFGSDRTVLWAFATSSLTAALGILMLPRPPAVRAGTSLDRKQSR